jgi:KaiC/GvpD/RAD55 family RecA-like ATPase
MAFIDAVRTQRKLRLAIFGVSGSGKTTTAMRMAQRLARRIAEREGREPRIGVIDTENGSVSILVNASYDGAKFKFKTSSLKDFSPTAYTNEIKAAGRAGFDVLIIDSLSHAWAGKGGALEIKDKITDSSNSKNSYTTGWREVTPMHNELIETMLQSSCHLFVTMRVHQEYVQDKDDRGRTTVRKIGMKPVQREGMEYEFDVVLDADENHLVKVSKTRCDPIDGMTVMKPGAEFMDVIAEWLETGDDVPQEVIDAAKLMESSPSMVKPLPSGNGAEKTETTAERIERLKAAKAASSPAATSMPPLVSSYPANPPSATTPAATTPTKLSIKPLQSKPAKAEWVVETTITPAETAQVTSQVTPQQPAEILTSEGDSATEACDTAATTEPITLITDADMPQDESTGPFILAATDADDTSTPRQHAVALAMYAALDLTPEVIEAACQRRSNASGKTVFDVCRRGLNDMINKARVKMLGDKNTSWAAWLDKINEKYAEQLDAMKEVPF